MSCTVVKLYKISDTRKLGLKIAPYLSFHLSSHLWCPSKWLSHSVDWFFFFHFWLFISCLGWIICYAPDIPFIVQFCWFSCTSGRQSKTAYLSSKFKTTHRWEIEQVLCCFAWVFVWFGVCLFVLSYIILQLFWFSFNWICLTRILKYAFLQQCC